MGALNAEFSDTELEELRAVAREHGMPMKAFVKASTADAIAHRRALKDAAAESQRVSADPALVEAIAATGIDDGPVTGTTGRAA